MFTSRKEAIKNGESTYYTGKECKNGHIAKRQTLSSSCIGCIADKVKIYRKKNAVALAQAAAIREEKIVEQIRIERKYQNKLDLGQHNDIIEYKDQINQVFEFWKEVMQYPQARLLDKRRNRITSALEHYSVEELKTAIIGCSKSDFHMGKNDSKMLFNDIELILRNETFIDKFIINASLIKKTAEEIEIEQQLKKGTYKSAFSFD
jgi:hypothetical protein